RSQTIIELRTNARCAEASGHARILVDTCFVEYKNVLHSDQLALHADTFGDGADAPRTVAKTRDLNEHIHGGADLLADGAHPHVRIRHADHHFQAAHRVSRGVGVNGG